MKIQWEIMTDILFVANIALFNADERGFIIPLCYLSRSGAMTSHSSLCYVLLGGETF